MQKGGGTNITDMFVLVCYLSTANRSTKGGCCKDKSEGGSTTFSTRLETALVSSRARTTGDKCYRFAGCDSREKCAKGSVSVGQAPLSASLNRRLVLPNWLLSHGCPCCPRPISDPCLKVASSNSQPLRSTPAQLIYVQCCTQPWNRKGRGKKCT